MLVLVGVLVGVLVVLVGVLVRNVVPEVALHSLGGASVVHTSTSGDTLPPLIQLFLAVARWLGTPPLSLCVCVYACVFLCKLSAIICQLFVANPHPPGAHHFSSPLF